jgi:lipopolysaccharide transport system ATP-binding protein
VRLKLGYECFRELREVSVAIAIYGLDGSLYTMLGNEYSAKPFNALDGKGHFICELDKFPLTSGKYALNISVNSAGTLQDWVQDAAHIDVEDGDFYGTGRIVPSSHRSIMIDNKWSLNN